MESAPLHVLSVMVNFGNDYYSQFLDASLFRLNLELFKARDVMHRPVITITPRESLSHLARLLLETSHGGFPVVKYYEKTRHEVAYGLVTRYTFAHHSANCNHKITQWLGG